MSDDPNKPAEEPQDEPQPSEQEAAPTEVQTDAEGNLTVPGPKPPSRGAQVRLTGEAQEAARGGLSQTMEGNVLAKRTLEADGLVADGYSEDGTTSSGKPAAEPVVTEGGDPIGEVPATGESRVKVEPDRVEGEEQKPQE